MPNKEEIKTLPLNRILRELYLLFPDPNLYILMNSLQEPTRAQNAEELKQMIAQNLEIIRQKKETLQNHFAVKEKEVTNFMDDPSNFLPEEWKAIQKIKNLFNNYQTKVIEKIETCTYGKQKSNSDSLQTTLAKRKRIPRKKDWLPCT